jgi:1-acyl-sn-glycerol-3-phosphate acyltransferase
MAKNNLFHSTILLALDVIATAFFAVAAVIASYMAVNTEDTVHKIASLWGKTLLRITGVQVEITGEENIPVNTPLIFMANHQSNFDILALLANIQVQFRWLSKKEIFYIPIIGYAMKRAGYISIDRENHAKAIDSLGEAAQKIREGKSVMTFPEGTRSRDGKIRSFKKGLFYLALEAGAPIIPISIKGSRAIMPKKSLQINPGEITIIIDKPIYIKGYSIETRDELMNAVRSVIIRNFYDEKGNNSL